MCKSCRAIVRKERRRKNPNKYLAAARNRRNANIDKYRETARAYYKKHIEKKRIYARRRRSMNVVQARVNYKRWYKKNSEKRSDYNKKWCKNNPDKIKTINARRRSTPFGKINHSISSGMWASLKGNKKGYHWETIVNYTLDELIDHLERQFMPGMTWNNYGKWHIDHIIPVAVFNFTSPDHDDFKRCWALSNLCPLWAIDNSIKGATIKKHFQPTLTL